MSQTIAAGKVVQMHYTLTNPEGQVIDSSEGRPPLAYLHGAQNIVPGLERQLTGLSVGDHVDAVVPPAEGYGELNEQARDVLNKSDFPPDFPFQVGVQFAMSVNGQEMPCFIIGVKDDQVMFQVGHPLSGVTLHFSVDIVDIRDATDEEKAHGHPHGPGGHHH